MRLLERLADNLPIDMRRSQVGDEYENLLATIGGFYSYYAKRVHRKAMTIKQVALHHILPKFINAHFIDSQSWRLFKIGLSMVKNLLRINAKGLTSMILEYEE